MNPDNYLYLSALLFTIGAAGVLLRRNAIVMFMCVELMLNAANLAFVAFSRLHGHLGGQCWHRAAPRAHLVRRMLGKTRFRVLGMRDRPLSKGGPGV